MADQPSILVVDDDASILTLIGAVLDQNGFKVIPCQEPRDAARLAVEREPDAIVLDVMMPGLSGLDVLQQLRNDPSTRRIPVLILSALGDGSDRVRGLKAGADDYLGKPFAPEELAIRVRRLIEGRPQKETVLLEGRLGRLSAGDVLQQALSARITGALELQGPPRGTISVAGGSITGARCRQLQGESALIVLLEHRRGRFQLVEQGGETAGETPGLSLNGTLLQLAWLEDELERHRDTLPAADVELVVGGNGAPPESECGHLGNVLDWYRQHPGSTLGDLEEAMIAAPQQVRLATALLVEAGLVRPADHASVKEKRQAASPLFEGAERLDNAASRLALHARTMGRNQDVLHVLVGVDPARWAEFLQEFVETIPPEALDRPVEQLLLELARDGSASLRIACSGTTLLVHLHRLSGLAGLRARAFLAMATAVVLAPGAVPDSQEAEIIRAATSIDPSPVLLLVPLPDAPVEAQPPEGWRVAASPPDSLLDLLEELIPETTA